MDDSKLHVKACLLHWSMYYYIAISRPIMKLAFSKISTDGCKEMFFGGGVYYV